MSLFESIQSFIFQSRECSVECAHILVNSPSSKAEGENSGQVFYTAYFMKDQKRPITFLFNGGPGGSSAYIHFAGLGPKIVNHLDIEIIKKDSEWIENPHSLFIDSDLVFVDPIGTGFSLCKAEYASEYYSEQADAKYLSEFLIKFMIKHQLWGRKIRLCGQSFGAYRVCLMAQKLQFEHQISIDQLILISPFISGVAIEFDQPNIIAEINYLISFICSAWYHQKSSLNDRFSQIGAVYDFAKKFLQSEYLQARINNPFYRLPQSIIDQVLAMTGLDFDFFVKSGISFSNWSQQIIKGSQKFPAYIDSRFTSDHALSFYPHYTDGCALQIERKLIPHINRYYSDLGIKADRIYQTGSEEPAKHWKYEEPFYRSAFDALKQILQINHSLKIYAFAGYYDHAVPAATVEFDLTQVASSVNCERRINLEFFATGHIPYISEDARKIIQSTLAEQKTN